MVSQSALKFISIVLGLLIFLNSIFALVNKNTPADQKEFPGQLMIISVLYMLGGIGLIVAGISVS
jgi:hypothetical protein